jgi:hypothetical protein
VLSKLNRFSALTFTSLRFLPSSQTSMVMSGLSSPLTRMYSAIASMATAVSRVLFQ